MRWRIRGGIEQSLAAWRPSQSRSIIVAILLCTMFLAACGGDGESADTTAEDGGTSTTAASDGDGGSDGGALAMSFGGLDIQLWNDILDMMRPEIEAAGYEFLVHDPQWDVQKQASDWQTWIARGDVLAIMAFPVQVDALIPATQQAVEAGITMLGYTQNWEGTSAALVTNPLEDGTMLGRQAGEWIVETYGDEPVKVAVLSDRATDITIGRTDGMIEGVQEVAPNVEVFEVPSLSRQEGFDGASRQLVAHPDTKVWIGLGDDHVQGAYRAVIDSGVEPDDPEYFFGSLDLTNESLDIMAIPNSIWRIGYVFTSTELAKANTQLLLDAAEGRELEDYLILPILVDQDNLEEFYVGTD